MPTRRKFLSAVPAVPLASVARGAAAAPAPPVQETVPLDGVWQFRIDPATEWRDVTVPHTWQVEAANAGHYGKAWYRRTFLAPERWSGSAARLEFAAVFHSATVKVNGKPAGEHLRKGYTSFSLDITPHVCFGCGNTIEVEVDNSFDEAMVPRGRSSDWAHDGGIYRPVSLSISQPVFCERIAIDAQPDLDTKRAPVRACAWIRNSTGQPAKGSISVEIIDEESGQAVAQRENLAEYDLAAGQTRTVSVPITVLTAVKLWHFDHPHLYRYRLKLSSGHVVEDTFGIRKIEVRGAQFYFNGEPVRLMGVERMAGSNPTYGMAEPRSWIDHDHNDMRELNCVYTRTHWPQDHRVLEFCDRQGMLLQTEVPAWGPRTFEGMKEQPDAALLENGLEQLREMIARDRNHPCIFSWGVCNETNGQNPPAQVFARELYKEAKRLDPTRLVTYASHSLFNNPGRDVAGEMDYIMFNQYFGSWQKGWTPELARTLDALHEAFPSKPIVISEYGYCACTQDRPENDRVRIDVLTSQDRVFRDRPWIAGLIFFCYNDYRTHVGDKGVGPLQQRVHGVVDLYGNRKPSFARLREESSPIELLTIDSDGVVLIRTRATVPAYTLDEYRLRAVGFGNGTIPLESKEIALPRLSPGASHKAKVTFSSAGLTSIRVDILRPDGTSAGTLKYE